MLTKSIMEVLTSANRFFLRTTWPSKYLQKPQMRPLLFLKLCTNRPSCLMLMVHLTIETATLRLILCKSSIHRTNSFRRKPVILLNIWNKSRWSLKLCLITKFPKVPSLLGSKGIIEILFRLPFLTRMRQLALVKKRPISILTSWETT